MSGGIGWLLLGVLIGPFTLGAIWFTAMHLLRGLLAVADVTVDKITPQTNRHRRAATAAVVFSAKRTWLLSVGNFAVAVVNGQRVEGRVDAYKALNPPVSLSEMRKPE